MSPFRLFGSPATEADTADPPPWPPPARDAPPAEHAAWSPRAAPPAGTSPAEHAAWSPIQGPRTAPAADTPAAEHAAWYGAAADPPPWAPPARDTPPAEHAAWSPRHEPRKAPAADPQPAYRPPHSGGAPRRRSGRGAEHAAVGNGGGAASAHRGYVGRGDATGPDCGRTSEGGDPPVDGRRTASDPHTKPRKARRGWGSRRGARNGGPPHQEDGAGSTSLGGGDASAATTRWAAGAAPWGSTGGGTTAAGREAARGAPTAPGRAGAASQDTTPGAAASRWGDPTASNGAAAAGWGAAESGYASFGAYGAGNGSPRSARPDSSAGRAAWGGPLTSGDPRVDGDPPTDPRGFPPLPAYLPAAPHPAEAAALAGAFAVDYLSWDEDDPERRGRVLVDYLPTPGRDPARLGWTGAGRQRAEFALPGLVRPDGDGRVLVDVRVRVTPYVAVGAHGTSPEPDGASVAGALAAAPAPTGRGWRSLASTWIRLSVPVTFDGGRMVIDAWDETLGEEPPTATRPAAAVDDHTLADDDPLQEPATGATP